MLNLLNIREGFFFVDGKSDHAAAESMRVHLALRNNDPNNHALLNAPAPAPATAAEMRMLGAPS